MLAEGWGFFFEFGREVCCRDNFEKKSNNFVFDIKLLELAMETELYQL